MLRVARRGKKCIGSAERSEMRMMATPFPGGLEKEKRLVILVFLFPGEVGAMHRVTGRVVGHQLQNGSIGPSAPKWGLPSSEKDPACPAPLKTNIQVWMATLGRDTRKSDANKDVSFDR
jgi:hypothetical protein